MKMDRYESMGFFMCGLGVAVMAGVLADLSWTSTAFACVIVAILLIAASFACADDAS